MKKIVGAVIAFLCFGTAIPAQVGDGCHVYVIDFAVAQKVDPAKCADEKDESKCGVTVFPEFKPELGEEVTTTKTYKFPSRNLMITANVFFTDEMLASAKGGGNSVMLSITVAPTVLKDDFSDENSAVAEFSVGGIADAIRVKRVYKFDGKRYFAGMECHFQKLFK